MLSDDLNNYQSTLLLRTPVVSSTQLKSLRCQRNKLFLLLFCHTNGRYLISWKQLIHDSTTIMKKNYHKSMRWVSSSVTPPVPTKAYTQHAIRFPFTLSVMISTSFRKISLSFFCIKLWWNSWRFPSIRVRDAVNSQATSSTYVRNVMPSCREKKRELKRKRHGLNQICANLKIHIWTLFI